MLKYFFHKFGSGTILEPQTLSFNTFLHAQGRDKLQYTFNFLFGR